MFLVDSHCHLNFKDFSHDIEEVIERARLSGVQVMQTICTKMSEFEEIYAIAASHEDIYCSVGVHPHEAGEGAMVTVEELVEAASRPKVIGLGETGLDYYYEHSPREAQKESFRRHIEASRRTGLPVIIHTREAEEDTLQILTEEMRRGRFKGLIHCFTSSQELAEKCIELGFYISLSGILTFKKATDIQQAAVSLPINRLLVETDAPYLAPTPHRGTRNEPSFTIFTNRFLSSLKGINEEECARITSENFFTLFDKVSPPQEWKKRAAA